MEGHLQILDMPTLTLKYIVFFDLWCGICLFEVFYWFTFCYVHFLLPTKKINSNAVTLEYMNSFSQLILHDEINLLLWSKHIYYIILWHYEHWQPPALFDHMKPIQHLHSQTYYSLWFLWHVHLLFNDHNISNVYTTTSMCSTYYDIIMHSKSAVLVSLHLEDRFTRWHSPTGWHTYHGAIITAPSNDAVK